MSNEISKVEQTALRLVNFRPRFSAELAWKLKEKGFEQSEIESLIKKFEHLKILQDEAFLPAFIVNLVENRRWSRRKIETKLMSMHLHKEQIIQYLDQYFTENLESNKENLKELIVKKKRQLSRLDERMKKQKIIQFLSSRGFNYGDIKQALEETD